MRTLQTWTLVVFGLTSLLACGGGSEAANDGGGGGANDGPIQLLDGGTTVGGDGGAWTCFVTTCAGKTLECGDCEDNDGDGEIDSHDKECLGPCDNTEGPALSAGIGGETGGPCKADCYFDFGNGPGNDDCVWDHRCDPLAVAPDYPPEGEDCAYDQSMVGGSTCPASQSAQCLDFCPPITPNGCDCFGCCTFPELAGAGPSGGDGYVWLGSLDANGDGTCTFADILDPGKCPPCTPVGDCLNGCGRCEICIGKPDVPEDCLAVPDGGVSEQCAAGVQACGLPGQAECPQDYYCITGCCKHIVQ